MAKISVFGLGKLGAPLAAVLASGGHDVVGVDRDPRTVELLSSGLAPVSEPGLQELLRSAGDRLYATEDGADAVQRTDVSFIVVPTPSQADGTFALDAILTVVELIGQSLRRAPKGYHLVVVSSTVMPASMDGPIRQRLEEASGLRLGSSLGLCYNPEFVALGSVIRDTLEPDLVLIGESDQQAGDRLVEILSSLYQRPAAPAIHRMNFVNAELAKIALNTFVTTKISYANMLARICERLPGASVSTVTAALGADSRIGPRYLQGAVGYGGPCFPRDNIAFIAMANALGAEAPLAEVTHRINQQQAGHLADLTCAHLPAGGRVAVLGLAYKPNSVVAEESAGVKLALELIGRGVPVSVYDPAAMEAAKLELGDCVTYAESSSNCIAAGEVAVLTVPWSEFVAPWSTETAQHRVQTVIDCWGVLDPSRIPAQVRVARLGLGPVS